MAFFAVIQRGNELIPVIKGGDGPNAECLATWDDYETACDEAELVPLAQAYPVMIFDTENEA